MGFPEQFPDFKVLGAVFLALAAACALVGLELVLDIGPVFLPGGGHVAIHKGFIIVFENGRDRDDLRAAVTVAAARAVCLHTASVKASELLDHLLFVLCQAAGGVFSGGGDVFLYLAEVRHAAEHTGDLRHVVQIFKPKLRRGEAGVKALPEVCQIALWICRQLAAAQGLHDHDPHAACVGGLQASESRLKVFVHVIELNLDKIKGVSV